MSEQTTRASQYRLYEGPAHPYVGDGTHGSHYDERMANDGALFFTNAYGERGIGWDFDPTTHNEENKLRKFGNDLDRELGKQALRNRRQTGVTVTDAGDPVTQRQLEAMMRGDQADRGTLIIYPDGDVHFSKLHQQSD